MQEKDVNGKVLFGDPVLCSQFIRDYIPIPILRNVQPEDIEDVTSKYQTFIGSEYKADTVKKIRLREEVDADASGYQTDSIYLVSLVEHKSSVDFDVAMQLLKYIVCIWTQYAKDIEVTDKDASRRKAFRYPPILPIVYYEGKDTWTADAHLIDRVMMKDIFKGFLPDFRYFMVGINSYSNEELLSHEDEMSFLMMLNKVQTAESLSKFLEQNSNIIERLFEKSPERIITILADTVASLCRRLNVPEKETQECVEKVRKRKMGYLFENMDKMDIQEERRKTKEAREQLKEARQQFKKQTEEVQKQLQKQSEEAQKQLQKQTENTQQNLIKLYRQNDKTMQETIEALMIVCGLLEPEARKTVTKYWDMK